MKPYTEELIFIDAEDGVGLDGALIRPRQARRQPPSCGFTATRANSTR